MSNPGLAQPSSSQPADAQRAAQKMQAEARMISGGRWFYWIAGLSVGNTVISMSGGNIHFVLGLGMTQLVDAIAKEIGPGATNVGLGVDIAIAGLFALLGMKAVKRGKTAFIAGMILYGLDGLLLLLFQDWFSVAVHAYALFCLFQGFRALGELNVIDPPDAFASAAGPRPA